MFLQLTVAFAHILAITASFLGAILLAVMLTQAIFNPLIIFSCLFCLINGARLSIKVRAFWQRHYQRHKTFSV
ncbi:hypothetical protein BegalDRAFT_1816 [Beggiatoa alba B18LD]|uniref:Uncharacterized protein n=1 Tax=Beggiatoa alba B18LD TaxID=395493 RepID=I3CGE7_9GAMM|nr:hypothetical protein [Beggiatoa alba]EIJ42690.1 hypothetical protein BegalDRAFT_1816 [Beggiatoa alba B18LD]